jgi:hypothetical protein
MASTTESLCSSPTVGGYFIYKNPKYPLKQGCCSIAKTETFGRNWFAGGSVRAEMRAELIQEHVIDRNTIRRLSGF